MNRPQIAVVLIAFLLLASSQDAHAIRFGVNFGGNVDDINNPSSYPETVGHFAGEVLNDHAGVDTFIDAGNVLDTDGVVLPNVEISDWIPGGSSGVNANVDVVAEPDNAAVVNNYGSAIGGSLVWANGSHSVFIDGLTPSEELAVGFVVAADGRDRTMNISINDNLVAEGLNEQLMVTEPFYLPGTVNANGELSLLIDEMSDATGWQALIIDSDLSLLTPIPSSNCDFNNDLGCDILDLNLLYGAWGELGGEFDLDASGTVDVDDIAPWLERASDASNPLNPTGLTYRSGDVNLDGAVDSTDLGVLLNNFSDSSGLLFGGGNLNDDMIVDSADLGLLLNNFGPGTASLAVAVPEPLAATLMLTAMIGWISLMRRKSSRCI